MKYLVTERQHNLLIESSSIDSVLNKLIQKEILDKKKYFWITKVHSVETEEREDGLDSRIILELNPKYKKDFPRLNRGEYSKKDGGWLYYGMEVENQRMGIDPYGIANEIKQLAKLMGLNPHFSLFNVYYIYVGQRTPGRYYP